MKVTGAEDLKIALRNMSARLSDRARKVMRRNAVIIVSEAKLNTPVDTHALEDSIHMETSYGFRGRLQIDIVCGGLVDGVNVDEYAMLIHENYGSMKPGPGTIAKRQANPGRYIGEKFLERAYEAQRAQLETEMIEAVNEESYL